VPGHDGLQTQTVAAEIMHGLSVHAGFKKLGFKVFEKALRRSGKMMNHRFDIKIGRGNLGEIEKGTSGMKLIFESGRAWFGGGTPAVVFYFMHRLCFQSGCPHGRRQKKRESPLSFFVEYGPCGHARAANADKPVPFLPAF
jgi:hypothetical protein